MKGEKEFKFKIVSKSCNLNVFKEQEHACVPQICLNTCSLQNNNNKCEPQ